MVSLGQRGKKLAGAAAVGAAVGLVAAVLAVTRPLLTERGEFVTYDWRVRITADPERASDDIIVVDVDDADLRSVEELTNATWPWPRVFFGYIADFAVQGGARAVMLDWIFQDRGVWGVEDLESFADAMRANERTVVGMLTQWRKPEPEPAERRFLAKVTEVPSRAEAIEAGVKLLAWKARVYLEGDGPTTVYVAGADAEKAVQTWMMMMGREELMGLYGMETMEDPPPPMPEPVPSDETGAVELTGSQIVSERVPIEMPVSGDIELPEITDRPPIEIVAAAAPAIGSVSQRQDADGVIRRHAFFFRKGDKVVPSLPMAAYLLANPNAKPRLEDGELVVGDRRLPVSDDGRIVLHYHDARSYQHIGAADILGSADAIEKGEEPKLQPSVFADKYVIVSATAKALRDIRVSPVDDQHLGAEINALALDNLMAGEAIDRTSPITDALIALLFALLGAVGVVWMSTLVTSPLRGFALTALAAVALLGSYTWLSIWLLDAQLVWLTTFVPVTGAVVAMVGAMLMSSVLDARDRRFVQDALGRYTSRELVDELVKHPEKLSLEWGEKREMSVYFSDIAGFTSISEAIDPEKMVALLNDYLTRMTDIVLEHHGVVDKYIGDAIMAFWGAPLDTSDHARLAVSASLAMKRTCDEMRPTWKEQYGVEVHARAGINTGLAVAGNMGSKHKYNYTVMGDMVNLASRLEGANKPYGTYLMISETTHAATEGEFEVRELDYLAVKGKEQPVKVYEVLAVRGELGSEELAHIRAFEAGLARYHDRDFEGAIADFGAALELAPDDGPSKLYVDRCEHFLEEPPPDDWDGVWRMKEK